MSILRYFGKLCAAFPHFKKAGSGTVMDWVKQQTRSHRTRPCLILCLPIVASLCPISAIATEVVPLTLRETVQEADAIVSGTIVSKTTRWGNDSRRWMLTEYALSVDEVITGASESRGATVLLTWWGGTIDGETQTVTDVRLPRLGEKLILMLKPGWRAHNTLTPVVGFNQGLFSVVIEATTNISTVQDATGNPVVLIQDQLKRRDELDFVSTATARTIDETAFIHWLREHVGAIKAAPVKARPSVDPNDPRVLKPVFKTPSDRTGSHGLAFPQMIQSDVPTTDPPSAGPKIPAPPNVAAQSAIPAISPEAPLPDYSNQKTRLAMLPDYSTQHQAYPPIVVNNFPASFTPWSPEDQYQMSKWNYYAPDVFRVYTTPTGTFAWQDGVFDLDGWVSSATMQQVYGFGWDAGVIAVAIPRYDGGGWIIETDIAMNPAFSYTLDDEWVYNGSSAQGFRQTLIHELGHMHGLEHNFNFLSVMDYMPSYYRCFGIPYMDDAAGIRFEYPSNVVGRNDLGVYLYYSSGFQSVSDSSYPSSVSPGGSLTVSNFHLENVGTTTISVPTLEWYLTAQRNYNAAYYFLGSTTHSSLAPFNYFLTSRTLSVSANIPPGTYYLGAFIRNDDGAGQSSFPFNNNLAFSRTRITVGPSGGNAPKPDFNGDGKADIVWQNNSTGQHTIWLMNGTAYMGSADLISTSLAWQIATTGDFNNDGKVDVYWQNTQTGQIAIQLMNGTTTMGWVDFTFPTAWKIVGTGDFNGDGKTDILWQNTQNGQVTIWLLNGTTTVGWADLFFNVPLSWTIVGTGDFNGDGKVDILWHNTQTGQVSIQLMNGTATTGWANPITASLAWRIAGASDLNSDGKVDILWQNTQTAQRTIQLMNGTVTMGWADLFQGQPEWEMRNH